MNYDMKKINELARQVDLVSFISQRYKLARKCRKNYYIHCPKHIDKTPSLCINTDKNYYYCFSCHRSGNLLSWLIEYEDMNLKDAVEYLFKITGNTDINKFTVSSSVNEFRKYSIDNEEKIDRKILDLKKDYLDKYCDELPIEWVKEGIPIDEIKRYNIRIDEQNNRIVYPVYDNNDFMIGVKGRTRYDNYKELGIPKYMNYYPIGTSNFFQGMHENKEAILKEKRAIIVEGLKSVMKLNGYGFGYAIASETCCLNNEQIKILLSLHLDEIIIAYDKGVKICDIINNVKKLKPFVRVSIVNDKKDIYLKDKDAPVDRGIQVWKELYEKRIFIG